MLDGGSRFGFAWQRVLAAAVGAAGLLTACEGKKRPWPVASDPKEIQASSQPYPNDGGANTTNPSSFDRSQEGQPTPVALDDSDLQAGSSQGGDGLCSGDGEADAGAACETTCPGCIIEGECVAPDALDPNTPCRFCHPDRNPRDWSPRDGVACDDGLYCTVDDVCTAGVCDGSPRVCEDGVACNGSSACNEMTRGCSRDVNACPDDSLCDTQTDSCVTTCSGCVVDGVCLAVAAEASGNPCLVCDPTRSTTAYSPASGKICGAGATACSQQDTCD